MEQLNLILQKLDALDGKVTAIDLSITGDPRRGVVGVKQHIEHIQQNFHDHSNDDKIQFAGIRNEQVVTNKKFDNVKSWIAGASFVAATLTSVVVLIVNVWVKTK